MSRFTVNGQPVQFALDPQTPLLWALRDAYNLTGAKYGCGTGECGACTVHVDGAAARACQLSIAEIEGSAVVTIEGLPGGAQHPVIRAFVAAQVPQCGYCIPGLVMSVAALLAANPSASDAEADAAITNICRCGVYPRLREAIAALRTEAPAAREISQG